MCNVSGIVFGTVNLSREEVEGKKVIEVGSGDVNGSLRPIIESWKPALYVGVDVQHYPGVDVVCNVADIVKEFGEEVFDIVVSTELLEHVRDWRKAISNMKRVCNPGGVLIITTRSYGFGYHGFPYDFWRYEVEDMRAIFADCDILALERDKEMPGVFLKARKPAAMVETDTRGYDLYCILTGKKCEMLRKKTSTAFSFLSTC